MSTLAELAADMRSLAADYRAKADALDRAVAALEGDTTPPAPLVAPPPLRAAYAPVGAAEPTLACPLAGCSFVARGDQALGVHLAKSHGVRGSGMAKRRERLALIEAAKRGETVERTDTVDQSAVPDLGPDGDEPERPAITAPQEPPTPSPAVPSIAERARELAAQPAGPIQRAPFDPDKVRARCVEGL